MAKERKLARQQMSTGEMISLIGRFFSIRAVL
jgi:hypothetical protein